MNLIETYPFTEDHIKKFKHELNKAGSFDNLMRKKRALSRKAGPKYILLQPNIEGYRRKYLIGAYQSLAFFYNTEMPYTFWSSLHTIVLKAEEKKI